MSASPPATATKRAASPLSPDTAQTSSKRVKEDPENGNGNGTKEDGETKQGENGGEIENGEIKGNGSPTAAKKEEGGVKKMEDDHMEGCVTFLTGGDRRGNEGE
jgi:hypothetical protein